MIRDRPLYSGISGNYGYDFMIHLDIGSFLIEREEGSWLDIMCGKAVALRTARYLSDEIYLEGVEKEEFRSIGTRISDRKNHVNVVRKNISEYEPARKFSLITAVYGLYLIEEPLATFQKACTWLEPNGLLALPISRGENWVDRIDYSALRSSGYDIAIEDIRKMSFSKQPPHYPHIIKVFAP